MTEFDISPGREGLSVSQHRRESAEGKRAEVVHVTPSLLLLSGEFDMGTAGLLTDGFSEWVRTGGTLTLEMSGVSFMDSTAIHAVMRAIHDAPSGCIVLHGVRPLVARVLHLVGLNDRDGIHMVPCAERDPYPVSVQPSTPTAPLA